MVRDRWEFAPYQSYFGHLATFVEICHPGSQEKSGLGDAAAL